MEQFATALGQAAFVDGLDESGRRKGCIPVSSHDLLQEGAGCGNMPFRAGRA
jgi:hypothetical protein